MTRSPSFVSGKFSFRSSTASQVAAAISNEQRDLQAFKQRIQDQHVTVPVAMLYNRDLDALCLRFLRARKFNLDAAWTMFTNCLAWRQRVGADTALSRPMNDRLMELIRECRPSNYIGYDPEGHPIFLERLGKLDGRRIEQEGISDEDILAYHLREMEFMGVVFNEASAQRGHTIDRVVSIMDAADLTFSMLTGYTQRLFRLITSMDSDNYPESCHAIYIVNGGVAFGMIWRVVSNFVDKGTRDKVHVLGARQQAQVLATACGGIHKVPDMLGGTLDTARARSEWLAKMDEVLQDAAAAAKAPHPQLTVACAPPGRTSSAVSAAAGDEEFETPKSAVSRLSSWSAASAVFFDARSSCGSPSWRPNIDVHSFLEGERQRTGHSPLKVQSGAGEAGPGSTTSAAAAAAGGKHGSGSSWKRAFKWGHHRSHHHQQQQQQPQQQQDLDGHGAASRQQAPSPASSAVAPKGGAAYLKPSAAAGVAAAGAAAASADHTADVEVGTLLNGAAGQQAAGGAAAGGGLSPLPRSSFASHDPSVPPSPTPVASVCATIGSGVGSAGAAGMSEHGGSSVGHNVQSSSSPWDREGVDGVHSPVEQEPMPRCTCQCVIS